LDKSIFGVAGTARSGVVLVTGADGPIENNLIKLKQEGII